MTEKQTPEEWLQGKRYDVMQSTGEDMYHKEGAEVRYKDALLAVKKAREEIFEELDKKFYYRFGKKPRVDMPKEWYDEIKAWFLQEKKK